MVNKPLIRPAISGGGTLGGGNMPNQPSYQKLFFFSPRQETAMSDLLERVGRFSSASRNSSEFFRRLYRIGPQKTHGNMKVFQP